MSNLDKQRILVVDDERLNRKVLSDLLKKEQTVILAKSGEQALQRVDRDSGIDLILLDVMMPGMDGYEVLRHLKNNDKTREIPVIFITARHSTEDEERGLLLGAVDYVTKPFNPAIVMARVANHLGFVRHRKMLETLAGRDGLTEIANRRMLNETLDAEWERGHRNGKFLSLAMVDIDFFKSFNDNYGHTKGDQALKSVARVLSWSMRRSPDLVARYGGEEFVLLFPDTDTNGARAMAEKVRSAVEDLSILHDHSSVADHVTVSIGGATQVPYGKNPGILIEQADAMLYKAKRKGRNQVLWESLDR